MTWVFKEFSSSVSMESAATDYIAGKIERNLADVSSARLLLSGGSSPRPIYEGLSKRDLKWSDVTVGLVDERWVDVDHKGSNAAFIKSTLLQNKAQAAEFVPMKTEHATAQNGADVVSESYRQAFTHPYICVMGMGLDGHTASWFPNADDLTSALDVDSRDFTCAFDATGCEVAGDFPSRMTMTLPAVMGSDEIILLIAGEAKRAVFEQAINQSVYNAPVKSLLSAGPRLTVFWGK
ncbi:MAG: 6-phosphogluconolactonase [Maricaulaceae bacterium]